MFLVHSKKPNKYLIHISNETGHSICNSAITPETWSKTTEADETKLCSVCKEKRAMKKKYEGWTQDMFDQRSKALRNISNEMYKKEREAQRAIYRFTKE